MNIPDPDESFRTHRNTPRFDTPCAWGGCVFLTGHHGSHSWESFGLPLGPEDDR